MDINKKIAIVTGASSGLGAALSATLTTKGAKVYGLARNLNSLHAIQKIVGSNFVPVQLDITDQNALALWVESNFSETNSPDILINNAGRGYFSKIDALSIEQWHSMINTNLNGVFYITSKIVPFMKKNKETSHIINIGSILGKTTKAESAAYAATKYAMQGFSESLFKELRADNIKVTCVNPGSMNTQFFEDSSIVPNDSMLQPKDVAELITYIIETPDNFLIDEITLRPLIPLSTN